MERNIEIGKEYVFFYRHDDGDTELLFPHHAQKCKVLSESTRAGEAGEEDRKFGGLFEIEFGDGSEFDVYGDELMPLVECVASKHGIYWPK